MSYKNKIKEDFVVDFWVILVVDVGVMGKEDKMVYLYIVVVVVKFVVLGEVD